MAHGYKRPWIVYARHAGVVIAVSRHASRESASSKVRAAHRFQNYGYAHVDELSSDMKRALGVAAGSWS
jgi:hypothetical protein